VCGTNPSTLEQERARARQTSLFKQTGTELDLDRLVGEKLRKLLPLLEVALHVTAQIPAGTRRQGWILSICTITGRESTSY